MQLIDNTNGEKIYPKPELKPTEIEYVKDIAYQWYDVVAKKQFHIAGEVGELIHEQHLACEYVEDEGGKQHIEALIEQVLVEKIETEQLKSVKHMVGNMALTTNWSQPTPKDMVEAVFEGMKKELYARIENETDVDLESIMQEATSILIGLMIKKCQNVSVDKDIAHMKYRVLLDLRLDYGDVDPWL